LKKEAKTFIGLRCGAGSTYLKIQKFLLLFSKRSAFCIARQVPVIPDEVRFTSPQVGTAVI
jgi:hypothetical protein